MDLQPYFDVVESGIADLGVNPVDCRGENPGQWNLKKGETTVWVDLWHIEKEDRPYFQVMSPIFQIPTDETIKNKIFAELLEINDTLYGVAFTVYKDWIYIKVIREAEGMDKGESLAMLLRVGNYADQHRTELAAKHGITIP
jgi:hypothetical protein